MDISKASNFERFVFDLVGRDPAVVRELWAKVDAGGSFDLSATPHYARLPGFAFASGSSSHAAVSSARIFLLDIRASSLRAGGGGGIRRRGA